MAWELGDARPTLAQLRELASAYGTTTAALLARNQALFEPAPKVPDFRRDHDRPMTTAIVAELRKARERRKRFLELAGPTGELPHLVLTRDSAEKVARTVRDLTGVTVPDQWRFKDFNAALKAWIVAVEELGVIVFQVSRIPTADFLGMSLYEDPQPIILLNGADSAQRRVFTLFHELGHLLSRTSGICDIYTESASESVCNTFASALLLPRRELLAELGNDDPVESLGHLAKRFRVSQSAIAVRLNTCGRISDQDLGRQLALARRLAQEKQRTAEKEPGGKGPPHHLVKLRNLGETYVSTVLDAMHDGAISPVDASYFLESKLPTVDRMERELARRAVGR